MAKPSFTPSREEQVRLMRMLAMPFGAVAFISWLTLFLPPHTASWWVTSAAGLCLLLSAILFGLSLSTARRGTLDFFAAFMLFPFSALVRHASGEGGTGVTALLLLPILWLAMTGSKLEARLAGLIAVVTFAIPPLLVSTADYPVSDWRRAVVWAAVALLISPVINTLVRQLTAQTRKAEKNAERANRLFADAPHGVAILKKDGTIVRINDALSETLERSETDIIGTSMIDYCSSNGTFAEHLSQVGATENTISTLCNLRTGAGNDVTVSLSSAYLPVDDLIMTNVMDVSDRVLYEQRLAHMADHDALTDLMNRRGFEKELVRHLQHCRRYGASGAILSLDLDNFKLINDTLGHNAGDELLVTISSLLRRAVRDVDVVCRLGGDEFAVLLSGVSQEEAANIAEKIVDSVAKHAQTLEGVNRRVTTSVGVVTFKAAEEHASDIMALSDMTMYDAKEAGRNQVAVLLEGDTRMPKAASRLQWQNRIETAIEHDRFELHLQPILDLKTNRVDSAEALLRLRGEDGELIPPSRFIYIAERSELITELDIWVVRKSIEMLAQIQTYDPTFCLEVNVSGHSIGEPRLEAAIKESLVLNSVEPSRLILEITETAAVADVSLARQFAERLTALGCRFALDDFGAGFGSFYYLKHLIFDFVKIDGEFVARSHVSEIDRAILQSIVGIAKTLGKETVAEFVDSDEVLAVLKEEEVDYAQGYWIDKPMELEAFKAKYLMGAEVP